MLAGCWGTRLKRIFVGRSIWLLCALFACTVCMWSNLFVIILAEAEKDFFFCFMCRAAAAWTRFQLGGAGRGGKREESY